MINLFKSFLIFFILLSCSPPIDYFGNTINLSEDELYLSKITADSLESDLFYLIFVQKFSKNSKNQIQINNLKLHSYLKLIMNYYGYTKMSILNTRKRGIIQPRLYVTVKYD